METNSIRGRILPIIQKTIRSKIWFGIILLFISSSLSSCIRESTCHDEMIFILEKYHVKPYSHRNQLYPKVKILHANSAMSVTYSIGRETKLCKCLKAHLLMELGQKAEAVKTLEDLPKGDSDQTVPSAHEIVFRRFNHVFRSLR